MAKKKKTPDFGFFPASIVVGKKPKSETAQCGSCGLYKKCNSPKLEPTGKGKKGVLIVSAVPSKNEDLIGTYQLNKFDPILFALESAGLDGPVDCWQTSAMICRGEVTGERVQFCNPNLQKTIAELDPRVIVCLGGAATRAVLSGEWKDAIGELDRWKGFIIPSQKNNRWICPVDDPLKIDRKRPVQKLLLEKHFKRIGELADRPWNKGLPNYEDRIQIIFDDVEAAKAIRKIIKKGKPAAFDYEANALLPETTGSKLYCASICNGKKTIAFPWHGEAIAAMQEFIESPLGKIASNLKYEHRWTKYHLGIDVNNWIWDTMLAAHCLDIRKDITSIKFQAFVHLGHPEYNAQMHPFFKSAPNTLNRIHQIAQKDLLHYCGMDSLLEYEVYKRQRKFVSE